MKALAIVVCSVLMLLGCQKSATVREAEGQQAFVQLQGAKLVLKRPLTVTTGSARVFVQGGSAADGGGIRVLSGGFDQYRPHCAFEIRSVQHDGFTIEPDTFRIIQVQGSLQSVVMSGPIMVASLQLAGGGGMDASGSSAYHQGYHFWLESERQPQVRRMSCYGVYAEPDRLQPPTLQEIRETLGDIAEIRR
jgi:hypothetical protein